MRFGRTTSIYCFPLNNISIVLVAFTLRSRDELSFVLEQHQEQSRLSRERSQASVLLHESLATPVQKLSLNVYTRASIVQASCMITAVMSDLQVSKAGRNSVFTFTDCVNDSCCTRDIRYS